MGNMTRTNFYYPQAMIERLRTASHKTGLAVSEIVRRAIDEYLKGMGL